MTGDQDTRKATAKGTPTLQAALLLLVIGVGALAIGAGPMAALFLLGAGICGLVGVIQKDSAARR